MNTLKNILLCGMVCLSIFLSSQVWLDLPGFLWFNNEKTEASEYKKDIDIDIWNVIKPNKFIVKNTDTYKELSNSNTRFWELVISNLNIALKSMQNNTCSAVIKSGTELPDNYLLLSFNNKIPLDIFIGEMKLNMNKIDISINNIKAIAFESSLNSTIYLYSDTHTVIIMSELLDNSKIFNYIYSLNKDNFIEYTRNLILENEKVPIPIPIISSSLNPVYVASELNVENTYELDNIGKDYFKANYDYVRKSKDIQGDTLYNLKNEKILKISSEGQLDFYDSTINYENSTNAYEALNEALYFALNFLKFPENMSLSKVDLIERNGFTGYKFTFTYRIYNMPILFSKIRNTQALEVEVIGNNVLSYKRFIRNQANNSDNKAVLDNIMSFEDVMNYQLSISKSNSTNTLKVIDNTMIKDIKEAYLAYFDLSRKNEKQLLRVVWVVRINDNIFIFNAKTGNLIEKQL